MTDATFVLVFFPGKRVFERSPFFVGKPARLVRPVGEIEKDQHAQDHCRDSPTDEYPLPADQSQSAGLPSTPIDMICSEIGGPMIAATGVPMKNQASAFVRSRRREPMCQINDHAGIKAGFGQPE